MTKIDEGLKFYNPKKSKKYANDWKLELCALIGFCFSGLIFILSGIQNGDILTVIGSFVWILSCIIWMFPYRRYLDTSNDKPELTGKDYGVIYDNNRK